MSSSLAQNTLCLKWIWGLRVQAVFSSQPPHTAIYLPSLAVIKALVYWDHKTILLLLICSLRPPSTASKVTGHSSTASPHRVLLQSYHSVILEGVLLLCFQRDWNMFSETSHLWISSPDIIVLGWSFLKDFLKCFISSLLYISTPNCFSSHSLSVAWSCLISSNYSYKIFLYTG